MLITDPCCCLPSLVENKFCLLLTATKSEKEQEVGKTKSKIVIVVRYSLGITLAGLCILPELIWQKGRLWRLNNGAYSCILIFFL